MIKAYVCYSTGDYPRVEIECICYSEEAAIDYCEEMDDCCTQGRFYDWEEAYFNHD